MGRDRSPKERQRQQLERKRAQRESCDRILIVSEGRKTEPNYFNEIRIVYRLSTASVAVRPSELGTAPIQVVQYAQELFEKGDSHKGIQPRSFEQVYAVFDRDDHDSYHDALEQAESLDRTLKNDAKQWITFRAIASVPCFELWLLLHYEDIQAPLHRDEVMHRLKQHLPSYDKGASDVFKNTQAHLDVAISRAKKLAERFSAHTEDEEPFTAIVNLVELLRALRPPIARH
jgi:hypothetical protein